MNVILKGLGLLIGLFIFFGLLGSIFGSHDATISDPTPETKIAYTRDGINFVSEERMDENIKYAYAKSGDYKKVEVPLNTIVVGASIVPEDTSQRKEEAKTIEKTIPSQQTAPPQQSETKPTTLTLTKEAYSAPVSTPQENVANNGANGASTIDTSTSTNSYTPPSQEASSASDNEWAARGSGKMGRPSYPQQTATISGPSSGSSNGVFVGSINSDKYHYPSCGSAKNIHTENEIWFSSSADARAQGYVPCGRCNPP